MPSPARTAGAAAVALAALTASALVAPAAQAADETVPIAVDGGDIRPDNTAGLPFKGLGVLSANSTSNLLMDYKAEHPDAYWQLIDVLFGGEYPLISHVKIEMGSDTNNSTGADAATMRTPDELADASRSPGWQLAADAKTVNPDVKVSILRWTMPQWVQTAWSAGTGQDEMYTWYKETILDAYEKYGFIVDYVNPDTNETTNPDIAFVKWYADRVANDTDFADPRYGIPADEQEAVGEAYRSIRIVASDENQTKKIGPALLDDPELFDIVDAVGYHYNTDDRLDGDPTSSTYQPYTKLATGQTPTGEDREVWYSEGVGSFGYTDYRVNNTDGPGGASTGIGGVQSALDLANRVVKGYANSKRTHYIFQPAIGSFYEGAQYSHKELLSARDPWSGSIHYDAATYVMRHFTSFAKTGWENADNTAGIWRTIPEASASGVLGTENLDGSNGAPSYMTLAAPDASDFSTVVVNDSDQTKTYRIAPSALALGDDLTAELWETRAADAGEAYDANMLHLAQELQPASDGSYTFTVAPRSIITFTTLDRSGDADLAERLPEQAERAVLDTDETGGALDASDEVLYADDFEYDEEGPVRVGVDNGARTEEQDYLTSRGHQPRYMVDQTGAWEVGDDGTGDRVLFQRMDQSMKDTRAWNVRQPNTLVGDFRWQNYQASVDVSFVDEAGGLARLGVRQQKGMGAGDAAYSIRITKAGAWTLARHDTTVASGSVAAADGYGLAIEAKGAQITAWVDGEQVATWTDPNPEYAGRVNLGTEFHEVAFDDLRVEKVDGYTAYASDLVDNMDSRVAYTGAWAHKATAGSADDWYRSTSTTSAAGATATIAFSGTGVDLIGGNPSGARIRVSVDGQPVEGATLRATSKREAAYSLRGLPDGEHRVVIEVVSGTVVIDGYSVISGVVDGAVDTDEIRDALDDTAGYEQGDYSETSWAALAAARAAAEAAVDGQAGLDAIGAAQLAARLESAANGLRPADVTDEVRDLGLAGAVSVGGDLPASVVIDGVERAVQWAPGSDEAERRPYAAVTVLGWTTEPIADGRKQQISARFQVVPDGIRYFIDSGVPSGQASLAFDAVSRTFDLANDAVDRASADVASWGFVNDGLNVKGGTDVNDIFSTGLWAGAGKTVRYRLPLDAGEYTLTAGFAEWWGQNRPMATEVSFTDSTGTHTVAGAPVSLSSSTTRATSDATFTLTEPTTVTYTVRKTGSQDPVISWLAVAQADEPSFEASATASLRCVGGKAVAVVEVRNGAVADGSFEITTPFGAKTLQVDAEKKRSASFSTREASVPEGEASVEITGEIDGEAVTETLTAAYGPLSCG